MHESFLLLPVLKMRWFPGILLRWQWFLFTCFSACLLRIIMDRTYTWDTSTLCSCYFLGARFANLGLEGAYLSWGIFPEERVPAKLIKSCPCSKTFFSCGWGLAGHLEVGHSLMSAAPFLVVVTSTWVGADCWQLCDWVASTMACPHP